MKPGFNGRHNHSESIRAASSDFEARRLLRQSARHRRQRAPRTGPMLVPSLQRYQAFPLSKAGIDLCIPDFLSRSARYQSMHIDHKIWGQILTFSIHLSEFTKHACWTAASLNRAPPRRDGVTWYCAQKSHGVRGKPDDDDGFTALAQLKSRRVALGSPPQSLGEDAQAESPRKTLPLTRSREKMDSGFARGFAPHPGDASGGGAIYQSSVDAADVDRSGRRDVLERANASAPLPLDRSAADS